MKRFETIDILNGSKIIDYSLPEIVYDESLVDKTHFIPTQEAVKRLANAPGMSDALIQQTFDFVDGKDNKMSVPIGRKPGADLAEISQDILKKQENIKDSLVEGARQANIAHEIDSALNRSVTEQIS